MSEPMITSPTSWQLLEHVVSALRQITPANGFLTNVGGDLIVLEASQMPDDDRAYTLVLATDCVVDDEKSSRSHTYSTFDVVIEVAVPFAADDNAQLTAHRARFDVMRALLPLRKDHRNRPFGINNFSITGASIAQPADGASVVIAQVTARAGLTESFSPAT